MIVERGLLLLKDFYGVVGEWKDNNLNIVSKSALLLKKQGTFFE